MPDNSLFISFEGGEGYGKTTQITTLFNRLADELPWIKVLRVRDPGGTPIGEKLRHLLKFDDDGAKMGNMTELLLFCASRAQLVHEVIRPHLDAGGIVIADRFHDSTIAYQHAGRGIPLAHVVGVTDATNGGTVPGTTFLLDMDIGKAKARLTARAAEAAAPDRLESEQDAFYQRVRTSYLRSAAFNPERIVTLDADRDQAEIADEIWSRFMLRIGVPCKLRSPARQEAGRKNSTTWGAGSVGDER
jgi:dTMP kinase